MSDSGPVEDGALRRASSRRAYHVILTTDEPRVMIPGRAFEPQGSLFASGDTLTPLDPDLERMVEDGLRPLAAAALLGQFVWAEDAAREVAPAPSRAGRATAHVFDDAVGNAASDAHAAPSDDDDAYDEDPSDDHDLYDVDLDDAHEPEVIEDGDVVEVTAATEVDAPRRGPRRLVRWVIFLALWLATAALIVPLVTQGVMRSLDVRLDLFGDEPTSQPVPTGSATEVPEPGAPSGLETSPDVTADTSPDPTAPSESTSPDPTTP